MKSLGLLAGATLALWAQGAAAQVLSGESPRNYAIEVKLGGFKPLIDREPGLAGNQPFNATFGATAMLLAEVEVDRILWQEIGSAGIGVSLGYAERYAPAVVVEGSDGTVRPTSERTGFFVLPIRIQGVYRFDWAALRLGVPLVPYAKAGIVVTPWWSTKGDSVQYVDGARGAGAKWGYGFTLGASILLDVLEPRLARDFDTDIGVNHSYLFAEYTYADVNSFNANSLDLSSRHWMFGIAFEF
jgi:hypothetical protein